MLRGFLITGERNICGSFEELFPELGAFPYVLGMLCVLLNDWQDTRGYYSMCATEIVIDFCEIGQLM